MMHSVNYGKNRISFSILRKERKALKISVSPDMKVFVIAPKSVSVEKIKEKVKEKGGWIIKHLRYFETFPPKSTPREYVSGETHLYLGRQYRLKVLKRKNANVQLKGGFIQLSVNGNSSLKFKESLLYDWYKDKAKSKYSEILDKAYNRVEKYRIEKPSMQIRTLKSRWGSCSTKQKNILLNTELIKTPSHCIEYVIMHELCHLKYPKHNKNFYNFLTLVMPDWSRRKERLERVVI